MERWMSTGRSGVVRCALVGGPMYDPLYDAIPLFERETGRDVQVVARLPHPELNAFVREAFESDDADLDLLSTHTKYAPSQADGLRSLDELVDPEHIADLLPRPLELSRIDGDLLQMPRNLDVRLLHYRRDLFENLAERAAFERRFGRPLRPPDTWSELADVAQFFTRPGLHGFLFPGRNSGLFGTFYELLVSSGGELFDPDLQPAFNSREGIAAAAFVADLHHVRRVTPRELREWHYDEISAEFRAGYAAMVCDWPGSYHLYTQRETCAVWDRVGLALLPAGPAGVRAAYAGCHSFAIPRGGRNPEGGAALLRFLTSFDAQVAEAERGAIPCRASALARTRERAASDPGEARRWALLAETERTMIVPPRFAAYPRCEDAIWHAVQQAMEGHCSPQDAVRRAAKDIQAILDAEAATHR
jgi:multiple sugar transport system substrate-binding protein